MIKPLLKFITPLNLNETAAVSKKPSFLHKILSETTEDTGKQASNGQSEPSVPLPKKSKICFLFCFFHNFFNHHTLLRHLFERVQCLLSYNYSAPVFTSVFLSKDSVTCSFILMAFSMFGPRSGYWSWGSYLCPCGARSGRGLGGVFGAGWGGGGPGGLGGARKV